jgi:4-amino-4-deoxy-L-arabinose transferase-like glycosyltransferase
LLLIAALATAMFTASVLHADFAPYYWVAAHSMTMSWRDFLFGPVDPAGSITIDKIPGFLWPQAASARIFGFHAWSLALPQVIEGVVSVLVMYRVVRRWAGPVAGLVAAAAFTLTPVIASMFGHSMEDGALTMCLILAADAWQRAVGTARLRALLLAGVWVGLGFQAKMLQAWSVLPAFALAYLVAAPARLRRRIWHLLVAGVVTVAVSASWMAAVTLTPPSQRPYVDGTTNNSAFAMVVGYNGVSRFGPFRIKGAIAGFGRRSGPPPGPSAADQPTGGRAADLPSAAGPPRRPGGAPGGAPGGTPGAARAGAPGGAAGTRPGTGPGATPNPSTAPKLPMPRGGMFGGGWDKLFASRLATQIGWLYPFALLALVFGIAWRGRAARTDQERAGYLMWGTWLLATGFAFSAGTVPHTAYTAALAAPIAALTGAGVVRLTAAYRTGGVRALVLPLAVVLTALWAAHLSAGFAGFLPLLVPVVLIAAAGALVLLLAARLIRVAARVLVTLGLTAAAVAVVTAPGAWATSVFVPRYAGSSLDAAAGPSGLFRMPVSFQRDLDAYFREADLKPPSFSRGPGGMFGNGTLDASQRTLLAYLRAHRDGARYLFAAQSWAAAAPFILASDEEVLPMGGFSGTVPAPTLTAFQRHVNTGELRYVMLSRGGGGMFGGQVSGTSNQAIADWVRGRCALVPPADYGGKPADPDADRNPFAGGRFGGAGDLYECQPTSASS